MALPSSPTVCQLCLQPADLKLSHIVPKFVWRWLKDTSPSAIRAHRNPDQRIQDGPKQYLLCADCEQRFSNWEKPFAERLFLPLHDSKPVVESISYEEWALRFAVSISWRTLTYFKCKGPLNHFSPTQHQLADTALEVWRKFLLGELDNPGNFVQNLLPVDVIKHHNGPRISPFLNRYFLRTVHIDVMASSNAAYVYTKMGRLILFGCIHEKRPGLWKGTQLHVRHGEIRPRHYQLPAGIVQYMNLKADEAKSALESISTNQRAKIDAMRRENLDKIANSETFRAMQYDLFYSGEEAFSKKAEKD